MEALREVLGDCESADDFGLRGDFIDAEAIGFIAARSVRGLPVTSPKTPGATRPTAGGKRYKAVTATVDCTGARYKLASSAVDLAGPRVDRPTQGRRAKLKK